MVEFKIGDRVVMTDEAKREFAKMKLYRPERDDAVGVIQGFIFDKWVTVGGMCEYGVRRHFHRSIIRKA